MTIPAPFDRYEGEVLPEWIDANDHMNLAYYVVLFDYATDALFEEIDIGRHYKETTGHGTFVAETHTLYERELLVGERLRVRTQILAADSKRLHLAHEMFAAAGGHRAAMQELMFLHVHLAARRVMPFPPPVRLRVRRRRGGACGSPRPDWVGAALPCRCGRRSITPARGRTPGPPFHRTETIFMTSSPRYLLTGVPRAAHHSECNFTASSDHRPGIASRSATSRAEVACPHPPSLRSAPSPALRGRGLSAAIASPLLHRGRGRGPPRQRRGG